MPAAITWYNDTPDYAKLPPLPPNAIAAHAHRTLEGSVTVRRWFGGLRIFHDRCGVDDRLISKRFRVMDVHELFTAVKTARGVL